jgi:CRP-like cAMP-binding protein
MLCMSHPDRVQLARSIERVELAAGTILCRPGVPNEHAILPASGAVGLFLEFPDATCAPVGIVGREGIVGLEIFLGRHVTPFRAVVEIAGYGHRVPASQLRALADYSPRIRQLVREQTATALLQASLTAACRTLHGLEGRTARWLLALADRVGPGLPLTQDALAELLGASRPTVNSVLRTLKQAGLINHARGRLAIRNRDGLEAIACPCYAAERGGGEDAP